MNRARHPRRQSPGPLDVYPSLSRLSREYHASLTTRPNDRGRSAQSSHRNLLQFSVSTKPNSVTEPSIITKIPQRHRKLWVSPRFPPGLDRSADAVRQAWSDPGQCCSVVRTFRDRRAVMVRVDEELWSLVQFGGWQADGDRRHSKSKKRPALQHPRQDSPAVIQLTDTKSANRSDIESRLEPRSASDCRRSVSSPPITRPTLFLPLSLASLTTRPNDLGRSAQSSPRNLLQFSESTNPNSVTEPSIITKIPQRHRKLWVSPCFFPMFLSPCFFHVSPPRFSWVSPRFSPRFSLLGVPTFLPYRYRRQNQNVRFG